MFSYSYIDHYKCIVVTSLLVSILTAGCEQPTPIPPAGPPLVEAKPAFKSDSARELHLSGSLSAERSISLSFSTIGTVKKVKVKEGDAVRKGQILATLDPSNHKDSLGIAEAKAKQAEDAYQRLLPMYQNKTAPAVKMVEIETGLQQARLSVSMARKNVADTVLRASVSGIVASRNIEPGSSASPGVPAFTLVQTRTVTAVAPVPEMHISKIHAGDSAGVKVTALDQQFEGKIEDIDLIANPLTRTYNVEVSLPNPKGELRVGMVAEVYLRIEDGEGGIVVPPEAVRVDNTGDNYVFVVTDRKTLQQRPVKVDKFIGEGTALSSGLREGEMVVTSGTPMLEDGMSVRVREPSANTTTNPESTGLENNEPSGELPNTTSTHSNKDSGMDS